MKTYRTALAQDGRFEVIETSPGAADRAVSRHPTKEAAWEWIEDHLRFLSLDDLAPWIGEYSRSRRSSRARA